MQDAEVRRATAAAMSTASSRGLLVDDVVVLHNSNKLTLRLLPCDVVARVAPAGDHVAQFEIDLARAAHRARLPGRRAGSTRGAARLRARRLRGHAVDLLRACDDARGRTGRLRRRARAAARRHAAASTSPRRTSRTASTRRWRSSRTATAPRRSRTRTGSCCATRSASLRRSITEHGAAEQLLHGEPHPGNVLRHRARARVIDLETCCRGPVEFDLAHAPDDVSEHYPGLDPQLLRDCRILVLAMVTTWRWDRDDQFPDGRRLGTEGLGQLRAALDA